MRPWPRECGLPSVQFVLWYSRGRLCRGLPHSIVAYQPPCIPNHHPPTLPHLHLRTLALQGKAYNDIREGTYYPAVSLYTNRGQQHEAAATTVNFGEHGFAFPPPQVEGCPAASPACELSGPQASGAARQQQQQLSAEAAAQQAQLAPPPQQQQGPAAATTADARQGQGAGGQAQPPGPASPPAVQQAANGLAAAEHANAGGAEAMETD